MIEQSQIEDITNGAALAAFLGAGIGSFAMGCIVLLNEASVVTIPTLYAPVGGLSGRTALATAIWLLAWGGLHRRWRGRDLRWRPIFAATLALTGLGIVGTLPPVWGLL